MKRRARIKALLLGIAIAAAEGACATEPLSESKFIRTWQELNARLGEFKQAGVQTAREVARDWLKVEFRQGTDAEVKPRSDEWRDWVYRSAAGMSPGLESTRQSFGDDKDQGERTGVWFPGIAGVYAIEIGHKVRPFVGAGLHFSRVQMNGRLDASIKEARRRDFGAVFRLGAEVPLEGGWVFDASYMRYYRAEPDGSSMNGWQEKGRRESRGAGQEVVSAMVWRRF